MWKRMGLVLLFITYIFMPACAGDVASKNPGAKVAVEIPVAQTPELNLNSGSLDPSFGHNGTGFVTTAQ